MTSPPRRVAVVGSGVAGLTAAYVASRTSQVTLFECEDRLGGHADTHVVSTPEGDLAIDTGFIVHNERTYPTLLRLFAELGVSTRGSEMSMSVREEETGLEYAGARGLRGLFPTPRALARPAYLRMLAEVPRFHRRARSLLAEGTGAGPTLREFLRTGGHSDAFCRLFMEPLVAAVWSCDPAVALDYPARYLFTFLDHHGMLTVTGSPPWRTVAGGSADYVRRIAAQLPDVRSGTKVTGVLETAAGVEITDGNGAVSTFDAVVIATHPDQALAMLAEPTRVQSEILGAIPYSANTAQLHTDSRILPAARHARASWNFLRRADATGRVTVTYDLTRLMRLPTRTPYLVTLGGADLVDPATVIATMEYAHPRYDPTSVAARSRLPECDTARVRFAGAYHGWGFHEDGARSGLRAAEGLGLTWPEPAVTPTRLPALYATTITHTRRRPWRRSFQHRSHTWLVDLDALPHHGVWGRFEARDHLGHRPGGPARSIKQQVLAFLDREGVDLGPAPRIVMASSARALGYCFNPISVFWCFAGTDPAPACVVVEVHNTYGDRHAYLVRPDARGRAGTPKALYTSPFFDTRGDYRLSVPVPDDRLVVSVALHTDEGAVFNAALTGRRLPAPTRRDVRRAAPAALRTALLIRAHGGWLWLRRLPVRPRPEHRQAGVQ